MKPCPFCGCVSISVRTRKTTIVECDDCKALFIRVDARAAIAAWNKRRQVPTKKDAA